MRKFKRTINKYFSEERLVKKLKKGRITLQQFKEQMKDLDPEDLQDAEYGEDDL